MSLLLLLINSYMNITTSIRTYSLETQASNHESLAIIPLNYKKCTKKWRLVSLVCNFTPNKDSILYKQLQVI